jgi:hypothetical protein
MMSDDNPPKVPVDLLPKVSDDLLSKMQSFALRPDYGLPKMPDHDFLKMQSLTLPKPDYGLPKMPDHDFLKMQSFALPKPEAIAGIVELNRLVAEATRPFAEIHRHMADVIGPLARRLDGFRLQPTLLPQIEDLARQFIEQQQQIAQSLRATIGAFAPNFQAIGQGFGDFIRSVAAVERKARLLSEAGFLPHVTMPVELVDECADDATHLSVSIEKHYGDNWQQIEDTLAARVASYLIDDEAKETFREALASHRMGHFRSVVRLLFPEIERVATSDGTLREFAKANGLKKPYRVFQELAGELPLSEMGGYGGFVLFERLYDHLYVDADSQAHASRPRSKSQCGSARPCRLSFVQNFIEHVDYDGFSVSGCGRC